jgi:uncharacterized protein YaeQ
MSAHRALFLGWRLERREMCFVGRKRARIGRVIHIGAVDETEIEVELKECSAVKRTTETKKANKVWQNGKATTDKLRQIRL